MYKVGDLVKTKLDGNGRYVFSKSVPLGSIGKIKSLNGFEIILEMQDYNITQYCFIEHVEPIPNEASTLTVDSKSYLSSLSEKNLVEVISRQNIELLEARELIQESYDYLWKQDMCSEAGARWLSRAKKLLETK